MPEYIIVIIRTVFAFFFLLFLARIIGKKQITNLTFFDYITGITIGDIAANLAIDTKTPVLNASIGMFIFTLLTLFLALGSLKSPKFRKLLESNPVPLIKNGNILEDNLFKVKMTFDDLMLNLRDKGVFKLDNVETAILETNGKISVMKKADCNPLTPKDMGIRVEKEQSPMLLIIDGHLLAERLNFLGYSKEWLLDEIMKQGAKDFKDVFLAQIDSQGNVYADLYDENAKTTQVKQKPLLAVQLRKIQVDLENYANQTEDTFAKRIYYKQSKEIQNLINRINPYFKE